jgi:hypothetical protein
MFSADIIFPINASKEHISRESDDDDSKQMIMVASMDMCSQFKEQRKTNTSASR